MSDLYMANYVIDNLMIIFSALFSGGAGVKIVEYYLKTLNKAKAEDFFNDTKEVIDIITQLSENPIIDNVLIFRGGNGGSVPRVGKDYYLKCIFEAHKEEPEISSLKLYENIIPDSNYITILLTLMQNKMMNFNVSTMEDGLLKKIYLSEGLKYSKIFTLHQTKEFIFYIQISTTQKNNLEDDVILRLEMESKIFKLKQIFKKHYEDGFFN